MYFNVIVGIKIIHKLFYEVIKIFLEGSINIFLICWWNIFHIKCHDDLDKNSLINNKSCFVCLQGLSYFDGSLKICPKRIDFILLLHPNCF
jgi:hypothetical protein